MRVDASREEIKVAKAQFYPNVNIVAFAGVGSLGLSNLLMSASGILGVGPAIHLPIFEGGRLNANLHGTRSGIESRGRRRTTRRSSTPCTISPMQSHPSRASPASSVEQAAARKATDEAYGLAVVRYRAGLGNYLTVLTAQTQQLAQDRLNVDLAARAFELDVNLARALGGGYIDPSTLLAPFRARAH